MKNYRKYGNSPFSIALIHGGPGGPGEMRPVAIELSKEYGVIEPLQTKTSIKGQVEELYNTLKCHADNPVTLIGFSWGAMLSYIFTANYPNFVKKLILISSGVFESKYAKNIMKTRINRLDDIEQKKLENLIEKLQNPNIPDSTKNALFENIEKLIWKADSYDPLPYKKEILEYQYNIYCSVWNEAEKFRKDKNFLNLGKKITCPVIAIHGDYDPHPIKGIKEPLSRVLNDFKTIIIPKCGHHPWFEKKTKNLFYKILQSNI